MRGDNRRENRHGHPTGQPSGRSRGSPPITARAISVDQGQYYGPPLSPPPYTNPVNNTDVYFHGPPQGAPSNTSPPRHPSRIRHHPHTQSSPPIGGHHVFNLEGSYNNTGTCRHDAFPLDATHSTQEEIRDSMATVASGFIQRPTISPGPQPGPIDVFQVQRGRVDNLPKLPCPVSGCTSWLGRNQEQRRHLLTHLPHWIHCPVPDCPWRGDRANAFAKHWSTHSPGSRVPNEDQYSIYDPKPLMRAICDSGLCIQEAQGRAISMVKGKASELRKSELSDDPWGSKSKRLRNTDPRR